MEEKRINPVAAFDVTSGTASAISQSWPDPGPDNGTDYRWLHFDLADDTVKLWANDHLPDIAAHALLQSETRPRCDRLADGLILNLRGVNLNPNSSPEDMVSLRMWVTKHAIVSARARKVWALDAMREAAVAGKAPQSTGTFLADLTHALTSRIETVSLNLEDQTDALEVAVLESERLAPDQLANLRQTVIKMRRFVNPQREAIATLSSIDDWIIAPKELALLRETSNRTRRIIEELDTTRDRLAAIQEHVDSLRSHAHSRNSYLLSVVAAIFLPLGFLTGLFGVNVAGMPGTETPFAFWALTGLSLVSGVALYLIFKFARWL